MKKVVSVLVSVVVSSVYIPTAYAETCPHGGSPNWQGICDVTTDAGESYFGSPVPEDPNLDEPVVVTPPPNTPPIQNINDPLEPPSVDLITENAWQSSSVDPEPDNPNIDPISQDQPETWAVVDENGTTINVISCDIDYCGSGWIPSEYDGFIPIKWSRVILQSARDPETGNNNGGHWGTYDFSANRWIEVDENGVVYEIPVTYGEEKFCIENCPVVDVPEETLDPPIVEESPSEVLTTSQARGFVKNLTTTKKNFSFFVKINKKNKVKFGKVWVIAKKNKDKKVWKFSVNKKNESVVTLPIEYLEWNIFINYKLKNNKKISKKIIINS